MATKLKNLERACIDAVYLWDRGEDIGPEQAESDGIRKALAEQNDPLSDAAPDLLAALQDCVDVMERDLAGLKLIQPELTQARAAIAKATGETSPSRQNAK